MSLDFSRGKSRKAFLAQVKALPEEYQNDAMSLLESVVFRNELAEYVAEGGDLISHTTLLDIGTDTHATIDSHIDDLTLHFTEGSIDHTAIQNIGSNTHAQIDTHISNTAIHFSRPTAEEETTTVTVGASEEIVLCNATGGAFTATMPTAVGKEGFIYRIKKTDSSANAVKVDGNGAETIDGDADFDLLSQDEVIAIVSDNANWWIV